MVCSKLVVAIIMVFKKTQNRFFLRDLFLWNMWHYNVCTLQIFFLMFQVRLLHPFLILRTRYRLVKGLGVQYWQDSKSSIYLEKFSLNHSVSKLQKGLKKIAKIGTKLDFLSTKLDLNELLMVHNLFNGKWFKTVRMSICWMEAA